MGDLNCQNNNENIENDSPVTKNELKTSVNQKSPIFYKSDEMISKEIIDMIAN